MYKKLFTQIVPALAIAACSMAFVSCSDDDEGSVTPTKPTETFRGNLVTGIGSMKLYYDDMGRCYRVTNVYGSTVEIDYDEGTISYDDEPVSVTFNGNGYITSLQTSWNDDGDPSDDYYETCRGGGRMAFTYDGEGHLVSCTSTSSESGEYREDGETYRYSESSTATGVYEWRNGRLVTCDMKTSYDSDGDGGTETHHAEIEYGDADLTNEYGQHTWAVASYGIGINEYLEVLSMIGMLGTAPDMLPTAVNTEDTESWELQGGETETWKDNVTIDYKYLTNGLLDWERWNGRAYYRYDYSAYVPADESRAAQPAAVAGKKFRARDLFFGKRARR